MFVRVTAALTGVAAVVAALTIAVSGAGADTTSCVASGSLPRQVSLGPQPVTVRSVLMASAGCAPGSFDNGGGAVLSAPDGANGSPFQWSAIGASDSTQLDAAWSPAGTYRFASGDVQTYNSAEERIPYSWTPTSFVARYASQLSNARSGHGVVTAQLSWWNRQYWTGLGGVRVSVQRYADGAWQSVATGRSTSSGALRVPVRTVRGATYRVVSETTATVWATASALHPW